MSRFRLLTALTVVAALALAGVASAKAAKVTGGSTTITLSSAATALMSANHLTATPISPATFSGSTFTFPIRSGRVNKQFHGFVTDRGGFALSNGTSTIRIKHLTVRSSRAGVSLWALVRQSGHRGEIRRIARISGAKVSGHTASGTLHLTAVSASAINKLAGKQLVKAGEPLGTGTISATVS